jgi:uncharacterized protein DUF4388
MTKVAARGTLDQEGVPGILRALVRADQTGPLRFSRGRVVKTVYLRGGRLIFATSTDPDDRLGEMLLRKGLISYRELEESVQAIRAGKRQGTALVESGAIRSRDLVQGVTEQVQEIVYSLFLWEEGAYEFVEGDLPTREVILLRMPTEDILMEGIRRVERWSRIQAGAGALEQRYALSPESTAILQAMTLSKDELSLVALLDGAPTLEEICAASRRSDFEICRAVWGLWVTGVLDRVPQDAREGPRALEKTEPHAEAAGAAVAREIEGFNARHRFLYELVTRELREESVAFFERAFVRVAVEHPGLFDGVSVDGAGELDAIALRRNVLAREIAGYVRGLDRLLDVEADLARDRLGDRQGSIIKDGLQALREQHLATRRRR